MKVLTRPFWLPACDEESPPRDTSKPTSDVEAGLVAAPLDPWTVRLHLAVGAQIEAGKTKVRAV